MEGYYPHLAELWTMNSSEMYIIFKRLFWRFETILGASIAGILIIDILIFRYLLSIESTFDDKIRVLTMLGTFTSVAIAAIGISYQVQATKEREIQFRIHQQRKETYEVFLAVLEKLMKLNKQGDKDAVEKIEDDYRALRPKLITYASPEVIGIFIDIIDPRLQQNRSPILIVKKYVELFLQIRTEAVFIGKDVPARQLASLIITDINEPNYNEIFDESGYLK